ARQTTQYPARPPVRTRTRRSGVVAGTSGDGEARLGGGRGDRAETGKRGSRPRRSRQHPPSRWMTRSEAAIGRRRRPDAGPPCDRPGAASRPSTAVCSRVRRTRVEFRTAARPARRGASSVHHRTPVEVPYCREEGRARWAGPAGAAWLHPSQVYFVKAPSARGGDDQVGAGAGVVGGEPVAFGGEPLPPPLLQPRPVAVEHPAEAEVVGGLQPDDVGQQVGGGLPGGADALDDQSGGAGDGHVLGVGAGDPVVAAEAAGALLPERFQDLVEEGGEPGGGAFVPGYGEVVGVDDLALERGREGAGVGGLAGSGRAVDRDEPYGAA